MKKNIPIIVTEEDGIFYACSPDVNKFEDGSINYFITYGETIDEAMENITEALVLELEDNKDISFSTFKEVQKITKENQRVVFLMIDLDYEMAKVKKTIKNKTVTLPVWLDMLAQEKKLNFSQILQRALKKELGIQE